MNSSRQSKGKALTESSSHEDHRMHLEEDNHIFGVVDFESDSENEVGLIRQRLQGISSSAGCGGSSSTAHSRFVPPIPQLRDKTTPEQSSKLRRRRRSNVSACPRHENVRVRDLSSILSK
ncbi:hypothetical protein JCGZ_25464 [Jatropha curcas]|uniref:Uncharacterized protein n=1 Tax=Jatropha curcas TaxID=180498 RepID=A0A067LGQ4_JATCU|nr:hypothetical protein JCGZ_25464 [Jatropha curcas]